tara:strand:- start:1558 stop:2163 length:606 start_codon:yes stop_codon:yes gene_type:complete
MNLIGLDFDNTLINYDFLFYKVALEFNLIPEHIQKSKVGVRDYLIKIGNEEAFTEIQGEVYGNRIQFAETSSGVNGALIKLKEKGYKFSIVSHKTKFPLIGKKYDLHKSAMNWLRKNKFLDKGGLNIKNEDIYFEPTKIKKIERINSIKCNFFIDDLEEILHMINNNVTRIHFNKNYIDYKQNNNFYSFSNWVNLDSLEIF